jgi:hypothetical protein
MKYILIVTLLVLGYNSFSQTKSIVGVYENKTHKDAEFIIEYELSLNADSTFLFHFYQDQICYIDDDRAKGKWKFENNTIIFNVDDETDINETYKLNFNKTKASIKGNTLSFFDCNIDWINNTELKKNKL